MTATYEPTFYEDWKVNFGYVPIKTEDSFEVGFNHVAS